MKKHELEVNYGKIKADDGKVSYQWTLKGIMLDIPEILKEDKTRDNEATLEEWKKHIGLDAICDNLEDTTIIRAADTARRFHVGTKNAKGLSDATIRLQMVGWKLGIKKKAGFQKKNPAEVLQDHIQAGTLTREIADSLMAQVAAWMATQAQAEEQADETAAEE